MSAIGGFASGLMAGREHRADMEKSDAITTLLDQKQQQGLLADVGAYETHLNEGGDPDNWIFQQGKQDPFLVRQFQKLKSRFSGGQEEAEPNPYETARQSFEDRQVKSAIPMQSPVEGAGAGRFAAYADGGEVDEEEDGGFYGALAGAGAAVAKPVAKGALAVGRKALPLGRKLANSKLGKLGGAVAGGAAIGEQTDSDYDERVLGQRFGNFEGTPLEIEDPGKASVGNFAKYFGQRLVGFASDLGDKLTGGLAGEAYRDADQPTAVPQPTAAAKAAPVETAIDETVTERPTEAIAAEAINSGVEATPGHPQSSEQDWDFSQLAADGVQPSEIAHVGVDDWRQYRQNHVLASIKRGMSVADANAEVDEIQHQGFLRNFRQATYLAMAGDTQGAALAARAAYQYFPNGSDLQFQSATGPDGNEYVVGVGMDEKTGEMVGTPQVMTPDYMNAMMANFEDPKAFNSWKKDQDEAYRLEREYQESRPQREADLAQTLAQAEYYKSGAQKNRAEAAAEATGKTGGPTEANKLSAHEKFVSSVELLSLDDEALADQLVSIMGRIYAGGGGDVGTIINEVKKLNAEGGPEALNELVAAWASAE